MKPRPFLIALVIVGLIALYRPVHTWLHAHLWLPWGILIGSTLEMAIVENWPRWIADRVWWIRWFNRMG